jgi:hypothetical protein
VGVGRAGAGGAGDGGRVGDGNRIGVGRVVAVGARGVAGVGGAVGDISSAWTEGLAWRGVGIGAGGVSLHAANAVSRHKATLRFRG